MTSARHAISPYFDIVTDPGGERYIESFLRGIALLRLTATNKGTAYTDEERRALNLDGLLPPHVSTMEQQLERSYWGYGRQPTDLQKYEYLRALQDRNEFLFFALLSRHLNEMLPIVYTPTVGEAVQQFGALYQTPRGLSFSPGNIGRARECVDNFVWSDVRMVVATDASAILGIGDQGYGGLAIPIGKLALYTVGGGVAPYHSLPVSLDIGTNRADLCEDPFYLGVRQERLRGNEYLHFMDHFVDAVVARYPKVIIQWEDLAKNNAFTVLDRFRDRVASFNDDIQGTGAVALAGLLSACKLKGEKLTDQRIVIHGAGAGGIGVALEIWRALVRDGLSEREAHEQIFVLDSKGLLSSDREVESYKRPFAHDPAEYADWGCSGDHPDLLETVRGARATVLLGLSGRPGAFSGPIVEAVAENTNRPIVFPLSNPTSACEATPEEVLRVTEGRALVATGSPFANVRLGETEFEIGQGNNAFIFPGLGFGAILADARKVTDAMVQAAATALADYTEERGHLEKGRIYPPVDELLEVSVRVAAVVVRQAIADGVATKLRLVTESPDLPTAEAYVRSKMWRPEYLPVRPSSQT